jgi:HK97 family phage portal protein
VSQSITGALGRLWPQRAVQNLGPVANPNFDFLPTPTPAGVVVTPETATASATVLACVTLIARSLASVPLVLYRRTVDGREIAGTHPLYWLLHDLANPLQSAFDVRETLMVDVLLYGNAYAEIEWSADGYPVALWPMPPNTQLDVTPDRQLYFSYFDSKGQKKTLPKWRVHHIRGLATQGLVGISPIRAAMGAVGLTLATEEFGARYFGDGAHPSIVLTHPGPLKPEAMKNLRESFEAQWSGMNNAHRIAVVGEGVKPEALRIPPNESQFLETRAFQVAEICRIFGVAPGLVGAQDTQTYASAEQDMIRLRELTLGPLAEKHEKAILRDLLVGDEQREYFAQYKLAKLQATDLKTRYDTHQIAVMSGLETPNERRSMEDLNPIEGGDLLWMPLNMAPAKAVAEQAEHAGEQPERPTDPTPMAQPDQPDAPEPDEDDGPRLITLWLADIEQRIRARVANDVRQSGAKVFRKQGDVGLGAWLATQREEWAAAGIAMLQPLATVAPDASDLVRAWVDDEAAARFSEVTI